MNQGNPYPDAHIVICDDSITNTMILSKLLESEGFCNTQCFTDPRKLMPYLHEHIDKIDLLMLDIEMPYLNGVEIMQHLQHENGGNIPFSTIIITGTDNLAIRHEALSCGANDFINKPFDQLEVMLRVRNILRVQRALRFQSTLAHKLEADVERRTAELNHAVDTLIHRMALAGEMRDNETGLHVARVGRYSRILAEEIGLPGELCFMIEKAAPLHDIGKIGIPDRILHKNGQLNEAEREEMNLHTQKGAELLGEHDSMLIQMAATIAYSHHERWDGEGYPRKLKGESIPIEGRIVTVADVFDALTTQRPYKDSWSTEAAFDFLKKGSGSQFDPKVVQALIQRRNEIEKTMIELRDHPSISPE